MTALKSSVRQLDVYRVETTGRALKLNQNEMPCDLPREMKNRILAELAGSAWNRYPAQEPQRLLKALARYTGHPQSGIMVGNSSNELIQTLIYSLCDSGDAILTVRPTFSMYRRAAAIMNIRILEVPLRDDFSFDTAAIIRRAREARAIILASPNNPTGTVIAPGNLAAIAEACDGAVIVDEAYAEFSSVSLQPMLGRYSHLLILRTFSKAVGLAGLRLGYLMGDRRWINLLKRARMPFSVGMFQQAAGVIALGEPAWIAANVARIVAERDRLLARMLQMENLRVVPSEANFLFFRPLRVQSRWLFRFFLRNNLLVRHLHGGEGPSFLRVTVGAPGQNDRFLELLKEGLMEGRHAGAAL